MSQPECLTYAFHKRDYAPPCGRCPTCLAVAPIDPPPPAPEPEPVAAEAPALTDGGVVSEAPPVEVDEDDFPLIVPKSGGWYEIVAADGEVLDKVRGSSAAQARAAELSD